MKKYNITFDYDGLDYTAGVTEYSNAVTITSLTPSQTDVSVPFTWKKQKDKTFNASSTQDIPGSLIARIAGELKKYVTSWPQT